MGESAERPCCLPSLKGKPRNESTEVRSRQCERRVFQRQSMHNADQCASDAERLSLTAGGQVGRTTRDRVRGGGARALPAGAFAPARHAGSWFAAPGCHGTLLPATPTPLGRGHRHPRLARHRTPGRDRGIWPGCRPTGDAQAAPRPIQPAKILVRTLGQDAQAAAAGRLKVGSIPRFKLGPTR